LIERSVINGVFKKPFLIERSVKNKPEFLKKQILLRNF